MLSELSEYQQCATPDFSNLRDELEAFKCKLISSQENSRPAKNVISDQLIKKRKDGKRAKEQYCMAVHLIDEFPPKDNSSMSGTLMDSKSHYIQSDT